MTGPSEDEQNKRIIAAMFPSPLERFLEGGKVPLWDLAEDLVGMQRYRLAKVPDFIGDVMDSAEARLRHRRVRRGRWESYMPDAKKAKQHMRRRG